MGTQLSSGEILLSELTWKMLEEIQGEMKKKKRQKIKTKTTTEVREAEHVQEW